MAKARITPSPKKGIAITKAKTSATPEPALRRSPRKAVQTAKKAEAEETAKVTKKASPTQTKTSTVKKLANALKKPALTKEATKAAAVAATPATIKGASPAPKKTTTEAESPAPKKTAKPTKAASKSPSPAKAATPAKSVAASPKPRGRPRKDALSSDVTASPRPRGRPPKNVSPAKVTKIKASPNTKSASKVKGKKKASRASTELLEVAGPTTSGHDSSLEDVGMEEIHHSSLKTSTSTSASKAFLSSARSRSPAKARINSAPSRLESPAVVAKGASRRNSTASSRSRSKSPSKATHALRKKSKASARSRSHSPANAAQPTTSRKASGAGARGRSKSPANGRSGSTSGRGSKAEGRSRPKSPAEVAEDSVPDQSSITRTLKRPKSPSNDGRSNSRGWRIQGDHFWGFPTMDNFFAAANKMHDLGQAAMKAGVDVHEESPEGLKVPKGVEFDPKTGLEYDKETTTQRRKNAKGQRLTAEGNGFSGVSSGNAIMQSTKRTSPGRPRKVEQSPARRSQSPVKKLKPSRSKSPARSPATSKARSPTKKAVSSPAKASARSPTEALARSPTKVSSARRSSADVRWDNKFNALDEYGKTLRKMEMKAYTAKKEGKVLRGVSTNVGEADAARAKKQGVDRAKAEFAVRHLADGREQRVREGNDQRIVEIDDDEDEEEVEGLGKARSSKNKSPTRQLKSSSTGRKDSSSSRPQQPPTSPRRSQSSSRQQSPACSPRRHLSSTAYDNDEVDEEFPLLPAGQPSAPNRGTVHSVTNPELINGTSKRNPFFETMPGPEVWHRNQPPYFMFGETPFMQQYISQGISEDLRKGAGGTDKAADKPRKNSFGGLFNIFASAKSKEPAADGEPERTFRTTFKLQTQAPERVEALLRQQGFDVKRSEIRKRSASVGSSSAGPKKPRRMSGVNGSRSRSPPTYRMSGAL